MVAVWPDVVRGGVPGGVVVRAGCLHSIRKCAYAPLTGVRTFEWCYPIAALTLSFEPSHDVLPLRHADEHRHSELAPLLHVLRDDRIAGEPRRIHSVEGVEVAGDFGIGGGAGLAVSRGDGLGEGVLIEHEMSRGGERRAGTCTVGVGDAGSGFNGAPEGQQGIGFGAHCRVSYSIVTPMRAAALHHVGAEINIIQVPTMWVHLGRRGPR